MDTAAPTSITHLFLGTAEAHPDLIALISDLSVTTFRDLAQLTLHFAGSLEERGLGKGDLLMIDSEDPLVVLPSIMSTALLGARWISAKSQSALPDMARPTLQIRTPEMATDNKAAWFEVDATWLAPPGINLSSVPKIDLQDDWLLVNTSGTTGRPKRMAMNQATMLRRCASIESDFQARRTVFTSLFCSYNFPLRGPRTCLPCQRLHDCR